MQLAHPMVAAAVAEHSGFHADPFARLQRTLEASFAIVFGTTEQAHAAAASVRSVHEHVVGDGYRADDPALLMWVHATLVDTALRVHERFLRPLPAADAERYYDESTVVAELLGVPRAAQPPDLEAFRAAGALAAQAADPRDDVRGSAEFKRHVVDVFVQRGLRTAAQLAGSG